MKNLILLFTLTLLCMSIFSQWQSNFGIGIDSPLYKLDVDGDINISAGHKFLLDGDPITIGNNLWQLKNDNLFYNSGKIGIGTDSPSNAMTIEGTETEWPGRIFLSVYNKSTSSKSLAYISVKAGSSPNHTVFGHISETYTANDSPQDLQDYGTLSSNGNGIIINATKNNSKPGVIKFLSGQSIGTTFDERMRIDSTGFIGIGTKSPSSKLQVANGDIYISDIEKGIIMKSPDGNCWRGVLDNSGQLNFTSIDCPNESITNNTSQLKSTESILVFPNPSENNITINFGDIQIDNPKYEINNINGQLIDNGKIMSNIQTIDISELTNGIYLLNIYDQEGNKLIVEKIIKE